MFHLSPLRAGMLVLLAAAAITRALTGGFAGQEILTEIAILAMLAIALDLVAGFGGMVSLCHGALMGVGAYAFGMTSTAAGLAVGPAMLAAVLVSGVLGWLIGAI